MPKAKITPEIAASVCDELAEGAKSLRQICESKGFTHSAFLLQVAVNTSLADQYTRARDLGNDAAFDRLREQQAERPRMGEKGVDGGWVAWKRLQTDTLKWELSKRDPRKYGEKLQQEITGKDGGALQIVSTIPRPQKEE